MNLVSVFPFCIQSLPWNPMIPVSAVAGKSSAIVVSPSLAASQNLELSNSWCAPAIPPMPWERQNTENTWCAHGILLLRNISEWLTWLPKGINGRVWKFSIQNKRATWAGWNSRRRIPSMTGLTRSIMKHRHFIGIRDPGFTLRAMSVKIKHDLKNKKNRKNWKWIVRLALIRYRFTLHFLPVLERSNALHVKNR